MIYRPLSAALPPRVPASPRTSSPDGLVLRTYTPLAYRLLFQSGPQTSRNTTNTIHTNDRLVNQLNTVKTCLDIAEKPEHLAVWNAGGRPGAKEEIATPPSPAPVAAK